MKSVFQSFVSYLLCDWVASIGAIVTTTSAVIFLTFAFQGFSNPYYGIVVFLVFPAFFVLGLILVPAGVWRCSKRRGGLRNIPSVDVTGPAAIRFFGLLTLLTGDQRGDRLHGHIHEREVHGLTTILRQRVPCDDSAMRRVSGFCSSPR